MGAATEDAQSAERGCETLNPLVPTVSQPTASTNRYNPNGTSMVNVVIPPVLVAVITPP